MKTIFSILLIFSSILAQDIYSSTKLKNGLVHNPNSNYSVYFISESALGSYINIVYTSKMKSPIVGKWNISERFWSNGKFSNDVNSFTWVENGTKLLVSTNIIFGHGKLYLLDLLNKEVITIKTFEEHLKQIKYTDGYSLEILSVNKNLRTVKLKLKLYNVDKHIINEFKY